MAARTCASLLLALAPAAAATYTQYPGKNAFRDHEGLKGAEALDHCERAGSTLDQCKQWCDQDCECHCLAVYRSNGACYRKHSCDASTFESDANWDIYEKVGFNSSCTTFHDYGIDSRCTGDSLSPATATNVQSLEQCKGLCSLLSFECAGVEYQSNCGDKSLATCLLYTGGGSITGATPTAKLGLGRHYHCLRYVGEVGNLTGGLIVPLRLTVAGLKTDEVLADQAFVAAAGLLLKSLYANASEHVNASQVHVELSSDPQLPSNPVIFDARIELEEAAHFVQVRQSAKDSEAATTAALADYLNAPAQASLRTGGDVSITPLAFNLTGAEFVTTSITTTSTTGNDTVTDALQVSGARRAPALAAALLALAAWRALA